MRSSALGVCTLSTTSVGSSDMAGRSDTAVRRRWSAARALRRQREAASEKGTSLAKRQLAPEIEVAAPVQNTEHRTRKAVRSAHDGGARGRANGSCPWEADALCSAADASSSPGHGCRVGRCLRRHQQDNSDGIFCRFFERSPCPHPGARGPALPPAGGARRDNPPEHTAFCSAGDRGNRLLRHAGPHAHSAFRKTRQTRRRPHHINPGAGPLAAAHASTPAARFCGRTLAAPAPSPPLPAQPLRRPRLPRVRC